MQYVGMKTNLIWMGTANWGGYYGYGAHTFVARNSQYFSGHVFLPYL